MQRAVELGREIRSLVAQVPRGRVATFADVAEALGDPRAAPAVFRILKDEGGERAHRIVRVTGEAAWPGVAARLAREGVRVAAGRIRDLESVRFTGFTGPRPLARLREEQVRLATRVSFVDRVRDPERVAGFDLAYDDGTAVAAAVVTSPDGEEVLQEVAVRASVRFPYVPGYLAYREFPAIERCYRRLDPAPDVLLVDGHGVLHPARLGLASFVGVALDRPTIGVAKSLLVGEAGPAPRRRGETTAVRLDGEVLGLGLRSGPSKRMIYVSVGHAVSLDTAVRIVRRACVTRVPEPLRRADALADRTRRFARK